MITLTGRTRFRRTWLFGALVLQVEERHEIEAVFDFDAEVVFGWRDARCEDFTPPHLAGLFTKPPMPYVGQRPA